MKYIRKWFKDFFDVFSHELKQVVTDGGFMIIFIFAGFCYPVLYNLMYYNGVLEDTPIAVVDNCDCAFTRQFIRELDATREVCVAAKCMNMEEAKRMMQERKVNGIVLIPSDFEEKMAYGETAKFSIYADMSSFLYYKNLLMSSEFTMLHEINKIKVDRLKLSGMTDKEADQFVRAIPYEENIPYNKTFSYSIFLISAILLMIIQQAMFYGMSMLAGTAREEHRFSSWLPEGLHGRGVGRVALGRGAAYWILFLGVGFYIACIIPALFGLPQRGSFWDIFVLLLFYLTDCVFFCQTFSSLIMRRETVFVLLLFMSPIAMFLTGFSWPVSAFPKFWKVVSCIFPSTYACRAFINLNTAGCDLVMVRDCFVAMTIQSIIYYFLANVSIYVENWIVNHRELLAERKADLHNRIENRIEEKTGHKLPLEKPVIDE